MKLPNISTPNISTPNTDFTQAGTMIRDGLADYEILRSKITIFILFLCILSPLYSMYSTYKKQYTLINGTIKNNYNNNIITSQTLNYTVNNNVYTYNLPIIKKQYPVGNIRVYYSKSDPSKYHLINSPMRTSELWLCILCVFFVGAIIWYYFIKKHKNVAAISAFGGMGSSGIGSGLGAGLGFGIGDGIGDAISSSFDF